MVSALDLCRRYEADPSHIEQSTVAHQKEVLEILGRPAPPSGEVAVFGSFGALVFIDGRLVGSLPLARPMLAPLGQHTISLQEGERRQEWPVKVLSGRTVEMRFEPESSAVLVTQLPAVLLHARLGALPAPQALRLTAAIEQAVQAAHFAVLQEGSALEHSPDLAKCQNQASCLLELAAQNNADYVLEVTATQSTVGAQGLNVQLALDLLDSRARMQSMLMDHVCKSCSPAQLTASTAEAVRSLIAQGTSRARGDLLVSTSPKSAEIYLDGQRVAVGRFEAPVAAGYYPLEVRSPGFLSQRATVLVEPGKNTNLPVVLLPAQPTYRSVPTSRPKWRLISGGVAAVLGLGGIGYGLSGIAIDGSCAELGPTGVCRQQFATKVPGIVFSIVGGALMAGGVLMLAIPGGRKTVEVDSGGFGDPNNE
jgi:hypothetical protein